MTEDGMPELFVLTPEQKRSIARIEVWDSDGMVARRLLGENKGDVFFVILRFFDKDNKEIGHLSLDMSKLYEPAKEGWFYGLPLKVWV